MTFLRTDNFRLTGLVGFRYLDLSESLGLTQSSTDLGGFGNFKNLATNPGDRFLIRDNFHTRNQFNRGELGLRGEKIWNRLVVTANAKVSLGNTHQAIEINGLTTLAPASGAASTSIPGGVLALASNSGRQAFDSFAVVPQVEVQLGYDLLRLIAGYDFLYWSNVVRPVSQVNNAVSAHLCRAHPG